MKRLLTLLFFAFFAITTQAQTAPNLPPGSVPFGTGLFRAPDGDIWGGSKFDGYTNLGNWQRVADSLAVKINWSDTTIIASKEWVEGKLNSLPPSGVLSVTGDGVDNTDPANPVLSYPDPADIGALAPGDNVSELTNDAGYLDSETDPVYSGDPASGITQNDIDAWDAKQDAITGAATTVVSSNLTPSRALISNGSGKIAVSPVSSTELAFLDGVSSNVQDQLDTKIPLSQKGASNGVAPIGGDGKIPGEYLPSSGSYKGTWDASTNTPTIADGVGTNGDRYRVSVGGTVDLGSGNITFVAGDDVIYNGIIWQRSPSGVTVTSVFGRTGDIVGAPADVQLGNVDNTSDMDKPISTAVQNALDDKVDVATLSDYYTKVNMQTSGQAQLHWDNLTNVPGDLGAQTLSLGVNSGEISLSGGGGSVRLASLYRGDIYEGSVDTIPGSAGLSMIYTSFSASGFPSSNAGAGILAARGITASTNGSMLIYSPTGNTNKLYYTTGNSSNAWSPFRTFASEEWVGNYILQNTWNKTNLKYNYIFSNFDLDTLYNGTVSGTSSSSQLINAPKNGFWMVKSENYGDGQGRILQTAAAAGIGSGVPEMWFRGYTGSSWTDWEEVITRTDLSNYVTTGTTQTISGAKTFSSPVTGTAAVSANQFVTLSQLQAAETPETVISTTVNFTIDWQTDIAPNSGGKTYAELHGNHFVYSAFYNDGSSGEVNYSPAVKITRNGSGDITSVQFGDIQTGNIVIK